jgi:hypothetical protein
LKFSFKKKIISHENKDIKKSQNENSIVDLSIQTENKEIEGEKEKDEKRENINHNKNINSDGKVLDPNFNSDKENKVTLQEETENEKGIDSEKEDVCNRCKENLGDEWKKPHWKWNMDKNIKFCFNCYKIKETEYEKLINYCIVCDSKLKFYRYNPRPEWKIKGQLCRKCWDFKNTTYKSEKLKE